MQSRKNLEIYYETLQEIQAIRITGMTGETYARYIKAGEQNIAVLERAMDELVAQDKSIGIEPLIPPYIPMPMKLPDMYMRHDRWDDAIRVYDFCSTIPYLSNMDFEALKKECAENRACADAIEAMVASGVSSQRSIRKALAPSFSSRPINYCLGYSCRFSRVKSGSDYIVSLTPMDSRI